MHRYACLAFAHKIQVKKTLMDLKVVGNQKSKRRVNSIFECHVDTLLYNYNISSNSNVLDKSWFRKYKTKVNVLLIGIRLWFYILLN